MIFQQKYVTDTQAKTVLYSIQYKNTRMAVWLLLTFLMCLHNQCVISLLRIKEYKVLKNVIHLIVSKNEWLLLSASFTAKFELFVITPENAFFLKDLKPTERA